MSFNISEEKEWASQYKKIRNKIESHLFEKLATKRVRNAYKTFMDKMFRAACNDCIKD